MTKMIHWLIKWWIFFILLLVLPCLLCTMAGIAWYLNIGIEGISSTYLLFLLVVILLFSWANSVLSNRKNHRVTAAHIEPKFSDYLAAIPFLFLNVLPIAFSLSLFSFLFFQPSFLKNVLFEDILKVSALSKESGIKEGGITLDNNFLWGGCVPPGLTNIYPTSWGFYTSDENNLTDKKQTLLRYDERHQYYQDNNLYDTLEMNLGSQSIFIEDQSNSITKSDNSVIVSVIPIANLFSARTLPVWECSMFYRCIEIVLGLTVIILSFFLIIPSLKSTFNASKS